MENPYLEKATRAVDERLDKSTDELQVLALIAIGRELRAIRRHLERDAASQAAPRAAAVVVHDAPPDRTEPTDGIVIG